MIKKFNKLIIENFIIFLVSFLLIDLIISNTVLNLRGKSCTNYKKDFIELKKNCNGKEKIKSYLPTVNIYTDSKGLRISKEHNRSSKKDKIFVYGSSFIYGAGLRYEKTTIGILEKENNKYEFFNFSIPYGSPTFHLYNLKKNIKNNEKPKKILLILSLSDILSEIDIWGNVDKSGTLKTKTDVLFLKSKEKEVFYKRNFRLSRLVANKINVFFKQLKSRTINDNIDSKKIRTTIQAGFTYSKIDQHPPYSNGGFNYGLNKIKSQIKEMTQVAAKENIDFNLIIFPFADTIAYGQENFNWENFAKDLCNIENCNFINTFKIFQNFQKNNDDWYEKLFFRGDEHFTELGHEIFTEALTEQIFKTDTL